VYKKTVGEKWREGVGIEPTGRQSTALPSGLKYVGSTRFFILP